MGMEALEDGPNAFSRRMAEELVHWTGVTAMPAFA
jgi:hypothetical protein